MKRSCLVCFLVLSTYEATTAQKRILLSSPDNRITLSLGLSRSIPTYSVSYKGTTLVENSEIGLSFNQKDFEAGDIAKPEYRQGIEEYELVVGKVKKVKRGNVKT